MTNLHALVYVSSAVEVLSREQLNQLLDKARARNIEHNITGLLLFIDGNFMQYIEGPADELDFIYQIIKNDTTHKGLIELMHSPIETREFANWSMAYCTKGHTVLTGEYDDMELLSGKLGGLSYTETPARILLHSFWYKNHD